MKKCVLEEKECTNCGLCDTRCELDPSKECDNCFRCLELDSREYAEIPIDAVYSDEIDADAAETVLAFDARERYVGERVWRVVTKAGWYGIRRLQ